MLKGIELANGKDDKTILIRLNVSMNGYYNLTANEIGKLSETTQDFFHLIYCFRKNEKIRNFVNSWMLKDPLQKKPHCNLWSIPNIFLRNFVFFPTMKVKSTATKN